MKEGSRYDAREGEMERFAGQLLATRKLSDGLIVAKQIAEDAPASVRAASLLSRAYRANGLRIEAIQALSKAIALPDAAGVVVANGTDAGLVKSGEGLAVAQSACRLFNPVVSTTNVSPSHRISHLDPEVPGGWAKLFVISWQSWSGPRKRRRLGRSTAAAKRMQ